MTLVPVLLAEALAATNDTFETLPSNPVSIAPVLASSKIRPSEVVVPFTETPGASGSN